MKEDNETPSVLGFRMPAEFEEHEATWLTWPHDKITFPDLNPIEQTYIEIIKHLHTGEKVNILVNNKESENAIKTKLIQNKIDISQINLFIIKNCDVWIRDYGPNFLVNGSNKDIAFNNWTFNAWGNKYDDLLGDNIIPEKINEFLKLKCFNPGIVLEGGSVDVNGDGICMTTEQCLLNKNRNPEMSKEQIETYLKDYLGVNGIIWLKNGIKGDDTDGHIDDIARFVNNDTILISSAEKEKENFEALNENFIFLKKFNFNLIKIPTPKKNTEMENKILPASYANFYIGNEVVLVPTFNDENDNVALDIIQKQFPNRKVVGIDCRKLVEGFGAIHCVTLQQPKA